MTHIGKAIGNPDPVGGLFLERDANNYRNRSTTAYVLGDVVGLDLTAATASVDATDSNSMLPGYGDASDDTVWNAIRNPVATGIAGTRAALFGVCKEPIATNAIGKVQTYGIVEDARCLASGNATNLVPGMPLTATITNSFNATITSNQRIIGFYLGVSQAVTNASTRVGPVAVLGDQFFGGFPSTPIA